jgi:hypothetical protein
MTLMRQAGDGAFSEVAQPDPDGGTLEIPLAMQSRNDSAQIVMKAVGWCHCTPPHFHWVPALAPRSAARRKRNGRV